MRGVVSKHRARLVEARLANSIRSIGSSRAIIKEEAPLWDLLLLTGPFIVD
jgi:hypothetical protein